MKELDDKNGVKDDVVGRIVRAKNQRAIIDCTDANNNTPLSEAASMLLLLAYSLHNVCMRYVLLQCFEVVCVCLDETNGIWPVKTASKVHFLGQA